MASAAGAAGHVVARSAALPERDLAQSADDLLEPGGLADPKHAGELPSHGFVVASAPREREGYAATLKLLGKGGAWAVAERHVQERQVRCVIGKPVQRGSAARERTRDAQAERRQLVQQKEADSPDFSREEVHRGL